MMRSTPNEFNLFGKGPWDYTTNAANIDAYWLAGTQRAKPFESVFTIGMRGFGDCKYGLPWKTLPFTSASSASFGDNGYRFIGAGCT